MKRSVAELIGDMFGYLLIFLIGLIGGLPLFGMFTRAGHSFVGFIIWSGIFLYAIFSIIKVEMDCHRP